VTEAIWVAIIAGSFGFAGSALSIFFGLEKVKKAVSCLGEGLSIGLDNDRVIFKALREHSINGESEVPKEE
jgi:hypothetical protein